MSQVAKVALKVLDVGLKRKKDETVNKAELEFRKGMG